MISPKTEHPANNFKPTLQKENKPLAIAEPVPTRHTLNPAPRLSTAAQALRQQPTLLPSPKFTSTRQDTDSHSLFAIRKPYPHGFNAMPAPGHEAAEVYSGCGGVEGVVNAESSDAPSLFKQYAPGLSAKATANNGWGA